jgi:hypothetical protein
MQATNGINRRTQFTEEDEEHLATWIAAKIPYKETGGRTGNRLYQQLCEMASPFFITETVCTYFQSPSLPILSMCGSVDTHGSPGANVIRKTPRVSMH